MHVEVERKGTEEAEGKEFWKNEFIAFQEREGLYSLQEGTLNVTEAGEGTEAFQGEFVLPGRVPQGRYRATLIGFKDGVPVVPQGGTPHRIHGGDRGLLARSGHGARLDLRNCRRGRRFGRGVGRGRGGFFERRALTWAFWFGRGREKRKGSRREEDLASFRALFEKFRDLLECNNRVLELIADMGEKLSGDYVFDTRYIEGTLAELDDLVYRMVIDLNAITGHRYLSLAAVFERLRDRLHADLQPGHQPRRKDWILPLAESDLDRVELVGGKMGTLGEIHSKLEDASRRDL